MTAQPPDDDRSRQAQPPRPAPIPDRRNGLQRAYATSVFYPTLGWNYLLGRVLRVRRWWDRIDPQVIVGAYPFARDVRGLRAEGVRAVVNTCEEYCGPEKGYAAAGIEQLRIPTTDFCHPRLQDIQMAVEFVQQHVRAGHSVYIHCKAGRARSATVALCWLVKYRQMSAEQAQESLLRSRSHINPFIYRRPVVIEFVASLQQAGNDAPAAMGRLADDG